MKLQKNTYSCGIFATVNAIRALGIKVTEKRIKSYTSTSKKHGTSHHGILNALERVSDLGIQAEERRYDDQDTAWQSLFDLIIKGSSAIIAVYKENHWIACVGLIGEYLVLYDSDYGKRNRYENGVHLVNKHRLFKLWSVSVEDNKYYSIIVSKEANK